MSKIEKVDKGKVVDGLHGGGDLVIPKPFNRQIFLLKPTLQELVIFKIWMNLPKK